jgi:hypothetical protein
MVWWFGCLGWKFSGKASLDIPLDCSIEGIKEELNKSNPRLRVSKVSRLKRRVQKYGETEWADTHTVSIVVRSKQLPKFVYIWRARLDLGPFISPVRQCFKCGRFSHSISKVCKGVEKCLTCAHDKHPESETCATAPMCINCKGNHPTLDRHCPKFTESKEICRIMAYENVPFAAAQKQFCNIQHNPLFQSLAVSFSNFPPLRHFPTSNKLSWTERSQIQWSRASLTDPDPSVAHSPSSCWDQFTNE